MDLDFALVRFHGEGAATEAFIAGRDRSGDNARWAQEIGFVEHHHNGHLVLRGTFAGHYVDIDEALHVSERGAAEGFVGGAAVGLLLGPPGIAVGMALGAILGSQVGERSETDPEPQLLADQLRTAVPRSDSAIVLIGPSADVDAMLAAVADSGGEVSRHTFTADDAAAVQASLSAAPRASAGPSVEGEQAVEASEA
jgi:uncharacterized membrane protein